MSKKNFHLALLILLNRLEEIKKSPMQDKSFVISLTEVLRYFKDNGELKEAFKVYKSVAQDIEKQPFYEAFLKILSARTSKFSSFNIKKTADKLSSDEFIENKINSILDKTY